MEKIMAIIAISLGKKATVYAVGRVSVDLYWFVALIAVRIAKICQDDVREEWCVTRVCGDDL